MCENEVGVAAEVRDPRVEAVRPADRLPVTVLTGEPHPVRDECASFVEPPIACEEQSLEAQAESGWRANGHARAEVGIVRRKLDRAVDDGQRFLVLADAEQRIRVRRGHHHDQRRVAGFLGERGRLARELRGRLEIAVANALDLAVAGQQDRPRVNVVRLRGQSLCVREQHLGLLGGDTEAPAVLQDEVARREPERDCLGGLRQRIRQFLHPAPVGERPGRVICADPGCGASVPARRLELLARGFPMLCQERGALVEQIRECSAVALATAA